METQREHILKDLEEKQQNASLAADEHNNKHKAVMKILDQLRAGMCVYTVLTLMLIVANLANKQWCKKEAEK